MFTGIIETLGRVERLEREGTNLHITVSSPIGQELKIDQSVAHNGVCLTVVRVDGGQHTVTAIDETLQMTNLGSLRTGDKVNLERCMPANGRFDGHIVQGHVDGPGTVEAITAQDGSWLFAFSHAKGLNFTVEKGSITVNGTSLTAFNASDTGFTVAIIPYTFEHTSFHALRVGDRVNLEFDIIGKYVARMMERRQ
ncbi:MAG: riboflavin synthase [Flavobacteriales bacterium]|nr:riboflavin synthase [Flavobacteriales bacterium]